MQEMIEPDRTILIVSVIGLIVIWGSVAYHKFVQDSAPAVEDDDETLDDLQEPAAEVREEGQGAPPKPMPGKSKRRKKGAKGR